MRDTCTDDSEDGKPLITSSGITVKNRVSIHSNSVHVHAHEHRIRGMDCSITCPCGPAGFGILLDHLPRIRRSARIQPCQTCLLGRPKPRECEKAPCPPRCGTTDVPVQPTSSQRFLSITTPGLRSARPLALRGIAAGKLRRRQR